MDWWTAWWTAWWMDWGMAMLICFAGGAAGWALADQVDRRCASTRPRQRPALAGATALLCLTMAVEFESIVTAAAFCVLCAGLVVLSAIDLHTHRLPREVSYSTLALGAPLLTAAALVDGEPHRIATMLAGAALALALMLVVHLASRGGLGDGDVRMAPLLGAYLGWLGPTHVPVGLFLGFALGALYGLTALALGRADRRTAIPFGPFLAAGTVGAVLGGQAVIDRVWPT
jgi:leader peptidase (prepilin peptidase)/N-methyltransferase